MSVIKTDISTALHSPFYTPFKALTSSLGVLEALIVPSKSEPSGMVLPPRSCLKVTERGSRIVPNIPRISTRRCKQRTPVSGLCCVQWHWGCPCVGQLQDRPDSNFRQALEHTIPHQDRPNCWIGAGIRVLLRAVDQQ